jgi:hypothetical protein
MSKELEQLNLFIDDAELASYKDPIDGRDDPNGFFPKRQYQGISGVNDKATGAKVSNLYIGGSTKGIDLEIPEEPSSEYTMSQVKETASGHIIEYDDTYGRERIMTRHRTGSGTCMHADGTVVFSSTKNMVVSVNGDNKVIVEGDAEIIYKGNVTMKVAGDFNLEVGGNFETKVAGNVTEKIKGSHIQHIASNHNKTIIGNKSENIKGTTTSTTLGNNFTTIKGSQEIEIGGSLEQNVGNKTTLTSENDIVISSEDINIAASSLSVFGDTGTIGGDEIVIYGNTAHIPRVNSVSVHASQGVFADVGMTAPTFNGNLSGNANTAGTAGTAAVGTSAGSSQGIVSIIPAANKVTSNPTTAVINEYLHNSEDGIRKLQIDPNDDFANKIDKSNNYGGVSKVDLSTEQARSKLRDPNNLKNKTFTGELVSSGIISQNFSIPTPVKFGRIVGPEKNATRGTRDIGTQDGRSKLFKVQS